MARTLDGDKYEKNMRQPEIATDTGVRVDSNKIMVFILT